MAAKQPILDYLQEAGFKGQALRTAWAIANRESGGNPNAYNGNANTGDQSYGLFQLNMLGSMGPSRRKQWGLKSNEQLFDPRVNAKAAFSLSKGGTDFGAWGVGPNAYRKTNLNYSGYPGPNAGVVATSGGGVPSAPASPPASPDNGMASTLAIINAFRAKQAGQTDSVLPLIGQLMQLRQQAPPQMPQAQLPQSPAAPTGNAPFTAYGGSPVSGAPKLIGGPGQGTHSTTEGPNNWQSDNAWDIAVPVGTPVYASENGTIDPQRYGSLGHSGGRFAGLRVNLKGTDNSFYYAHLSKIAVKPGATVKKGQLLGYSGEANGVPHLHYGVEYLG